VLHLVLVVLFASCVAANWQNELTLSLTKAQIKVLLKMDQQVGLIFAPKFTKPLVWTVFQPIGPTRLAWNATGLSVYARRGGSMSFTPAVRGQIFQFDSSLFTRLGNLDPSKEAIGVLLDSKEGWDVGLRRDIAINDNITPDNPTSLLKMLPKESAELSTDGTVYLFVCSKFVQAGMPVADIGEVALANPGLVEVKDGRYAYNHLCATLRQDWTWSIENGECDNDDGS